MPHLPLPFEKIEVTPMALMKALQGRGWLHRETLALELGCSVRSVRIAAQEAKGAVLSGQSGLRLTAEASELELNECLGIFTSSISSLSERVVQTRAAWDLTHGV